MMNNLNDLVFGNEIYIPKYKWDFFNSIYTKEELKDYLVKTIRTYNIPFPFKKYDFQKNVFTEFNRLKKIPISRLLKKGKTCTKFEYKYNLSNYYIGSNSIGNSCSDYFHYKSRFECQSIRGISPIDIWNDDKLLKEALNTLWSLKMKEVNTNDLRACIRLKFYIASQFKPSIAKIVYTLFNSENVFDLSSGWGDRLLGFFTSENTKHYQGFDPNSKLHSGYKEQIKVYSKYSLEKTADITCLPVEDATWNHFHNKFDIVFTSPPYFNTEKYTNEKTQSWNRYTSIESWLKNFLFKILEESWKVLREDGILAINVTDSGKNKICDPMNDFISKFPNANYVGELGMTMAQRPNMKFMKGQSGTFIEPIWIWSKNKLKLKDYINKFIGTTKVCDNKVPNNSDYIHKQKQENIDKTKRIEKSGKDLIDFF